MHGTSAVYALVTIRTINSSAGVKKRRHRGLARVWPGRREGSAPRGTLALFGGQARTGGVSLSLGTHESAWARIFPRLQHRRHPLPEGEPALSRLFFIREW